MYSDGEESKVREFRKEPTPCLHLRRLNGESPAILSIARRKLQSNLLVEYISDRPGDPPLRQGLQAKNGIRGHCHHNSPPPPLPPQKLHDDRYRAFSVKYHGLVAHDILQGIVEHHPTQIFLQRVLSLLVGFEG